MMLKYYSIEPMDCDLLIYEQAKYYTYTYTQPNSIVRVSQFMTEVQKKIEH
jgi:hypothetical protein